MNFYSITLDINDRREHQLELYQRGFEHRLQKPKSFVIDVPNFHHFKLISVQNSLFIKSFVLEGEDLLLSSCTKSIIKHGNKIIIQLDGNKKNPPLFEPIIKPIQKENDDVSFEEIEDFVNYNKPKEKKVEETVQIAELNEDLGAINDTLSLKFVDNNYGLKLEAHLHSTLTEHPFDTPLIEVLIQLKIGDILYENSIHLHLSHPAEFIGLALDFGSESSQMAVKRYELTPPFYPNAADNENLFRNIVNYHKNKGWIPRENNYDFYQEEPGTNFYKSIFFLKEQLSGDYGNVDQEPFIKNAEENLKMLVNKQDGFKTLTDNKYYQLPNLKILHKHERVLEDFNFEIEKNGYPINLKLRELKQKVYNTILENIIVSFLKKEFIRYDNAKRNIRMMLLIPNNYDTKDINKTQYHLNMIFEALKQKDEFKDCIGAWEILTISESDASFIGYINKNNVNIQNNRDYIIIDSGKGTTDFSIIRTGSKNLYNLNPVYRNGFTGAGNMITYAVFETLVHYIRESNPEHGADVLFIKEKILKVLRSNDLETRNKFFNEIERLKFNYKDKNYESSVRSSWMEAADGDLKFFNLIHSFNTADIGLAAVTNLISKVNGVTDFYGYIHDACQFICNNVVSYLKIIKENKEDLSLSGVVLTGRAFNFKLLAEMLIKKINTELNIPVDKISLLSGNELKDICIKGVFNNAIKLNAEVTGYPIQLVYRTQQDVPVSEITAKPKKNLGKRIFNFFINDLADMENVESIISVNDKVDFKDLQRSQFLIGCKRYSIRNDEFFTTQAGLNYSASIDFTQRGFVMRRKIGSKINFISALEEIDEGGSGDKSLIVPSLFPNYLDETFLQSLQTESINKTSIRSSQLDRKEPPLYIPSNINNDSNDNDVDNSSPQNGNPLFF